MLQTVFFWKHSFLCTAGKKGSVLFNMWNSKYLLWAGKGQGVLFPGLICESYHLAAQQKSTTQNKKSVGLYFFCAAQKLLFYADSKILLLYYYPLENGSFTYWNTGEPQYIF